MIPKYYPLSPADIHPGDIIEDRLNHDRGIVRSVNKAAGLATFSVIVYFASRDYVKEYIVRIGNIPLTIIRAAGRIDPRNPTKEPKREVYRQAKEEELRTRVNTPPEDNVTLPDRKPVTRAETELTRVKEESRSLEDRSGYVGSKTNLVSESKIKQFLRDSNLLTIKRIKMGGDPYHISNIDMVNDLPRLFQKHITDGSRFPHYGIGSFGSETNKLLYSKLQQELQIANHILEYYGGNRTGAISKLNKYFPLPLGQPLSTSQILTGYRTPSKDPIETYINEIISRRYGVRNKKFLHDITTFRNELQSLVSAFESFWNSHGEQLYVKKKIYSTQQIANENIWKSIWEDIGGGKSKWMGRRPIGGLSSIFNITPNLSRDMKDIRRILLEAYEGTLDPSLYLNVLRALRSKGLGRTDIKHVLSNISIDHILGTEVAGPGEATSLLRITSDYISQNERALKGNLFKFRGFAGQVRSPFMMQMVENVLQAATTEGLGQAANTFRATIQGSQQQIQRIYGREYQEVVTEQANFIANFLEGRLKKRREVINRAWDSLPGSIPDRPDIPINPLKVRQEAIYQLGVEDLPEEDYATRLLQRRAIDIANMSYADFLALGNTTLFENKIPGDIMDLLGSAKSLLSQGIPLGFTDPRSSIKYRITDVDLFSPLSKSLSVVPESIPGGRLSIKIPTQGSTIVEIIQNLLNQGDTTPTTPLLPGTTSEPFVSAQLSPFKSITIGGKTYNQDEVLQLYGLGQGRGTRKLPFRNIYTRLRVGMEDKVLEEAGALKEAFLLFIHEPAHKTFNTFEEFEEAAKRRMPTLAKRILRAEVTSRTSWNYLQQELGDSVESLTKRIVGENPYDTLLKKFGLDPGILPKSPLDLLRGTVEGERHLLADIAPEVFPHLVVAREISNLEGSIASLRKLSNDRLYEALELLLDRETSEEELLRPRGRWERFLWDLPFSTRSQLLDMPTSQVRSEMEDILTGRLFYGTLNRRFGPQNAELLREAYLKGGKKSLLEATRSISLPTNFSFEEFLIKSHNIVQEIVSGKIISDRLSPEAIEAAPLLQKKLGEARFIRGILSSRGDLSLAERLLDFPEAATRIGTEHFSMPIRGNEDFSNLEVHIKNAPRSKPGEIPGREIWLKTGKTNKRYVVPEGEVGGWYPSGKETGYLRQQLLWDPDTKTFLSVAPIEGVAERRGAELLKGVQKLGVNSIFPTTPRIGTLPLWRLPDGRMMFFAGDPGHQATLIDELIKDPTRTILSVDIEAGGLNYETLTAMGVRVGAFNNTRFIRGGGISTPEWTGRQTKSNIQRLEESRIHTLLNTPGAEGEIKILRWADEFLTKYHNAIITSHNWDVDLQKAGRIGAKHLGVSEQQKALLLSRQAQVRKEIKNYKRKIKDGGIVSVELSQLENEYRNIEIQLNEYSTQIESLREIVGRIIATRSRTLDTIAMAQAAGLVSGELNLEAVLRTRGILKPGQYFAAHIAEVDAMFGGKLAVNLARLGKVKKALAGATPLDIEEYFNKPFLYTRSWDEGEKLSDRIFTLQNIVPAQRGEEKGFNILFQEHGYLGNMIQRDPFFAKDPLVLAGFLESLAPVKDIQATQKFIAEDLARRTYRRIVSPDKKVNFRSPLSFELFKEKAELVLDPATRDVKISTWEQILNAERAQFGYPVTPEGKEAASLLKWAKDWLPDERIQAQYLALRNTFEKEFLPHHWPFLEEIRNQIRTGTISRQEAHSLVRNRMEAFTKSFPTITQEITTPPDIPRITPNVGLSQPIAINLNTIITTRQTLQDIAEKMASDELSAEIFTKHGILDPKDKRVPRGKKLSARVEIAEIVTRSNPQFLKGIQELIDIDSDETRTLDILAKRIYNKYRGGKDPISQVITADDVLSPRVVNQDIVSTIDERFLSQRSINNIRRRLVERTPFKFTNKLPSWLLKLKPGDISIEGFTPEEVLSTYGGVGAGGLSRILESEERQWQRNANYRLSSEERALIRSKLKWDRSLGEAIIPTYDRTKTTTLGEIAQSPEALRDLINRTRRPLPLEQALMNFRQVSGREFDPYEGLERLQSPVRDLITQVNEATKAAGGRIPPNQAPPPGVIVATAQRATEVVTERVASMGGGYAILGATALGAVAMGLRSPNLSARTSPKVETLEENVERVLPDGEHTKEIPQYYQIKARIQGKIFGNPSTDTLVHLIHQAAERHMTSEAPMEKTHNINDQRDNITNHKIDRAIAEILSRSRR